MKKGKRLKARWCFKDIAPLNTREELGRFRTKRMKNSVARRGNIKMVLADVHAGNWDCACRLRASRSCDQPVRVA